MSERAAKNSILAAWSQNSGAKAGAIGLALFSALGVACAGGEQPFHPLAGDEPPIRVRNGSMYLELLDNTFEFEENGNKKNWKIKGDPPRGRPEYTLVVIASDPNACASQLVTTPRVEFVYDSGQTIELMAAGRKTLIKSRDDIDHVPNARHILEYKSPNESETAKGYISKIKIGNSGTDHCTFSPDPSLRVYLLE